METYEPQTFPSFKDESLYSAQASRASQVPLPASEKAVKMTAGSGTQCSMWLNESSPLGAFSRILLGSSAWTNSEEFCYVWNRLDTRFGLSAFQLTPLAQSTEGSESSLWRTPNASDVTGGPMNGEARLEQGHHLNLCEQPATPKLWPTPQCKDTDRTPETVAAKLWPTPVVNDARNGRNATANRSNPDSKHHDGTTLSDAVRLWPTPTVIDGGSGGRNVEHILEYGTNSNLRNAAKLYPTPTVPNGGRRNPEGTSITGRKPDGGKAQIDLREYAIRSLNGTFPTLTSTMKTIGDMRQAHVAGRISADGTGGSLNPRFVCQLMGYEADHTNLKHWETLLSRSRSIRSSRRSRKRKLASQALAEFKWLKL
jgi:hypothetical protein